MITRQKAEKRAVLCYVFLFYKEFHSFCNKCVYFSGCTSELLTRVYCMWKQYSMYQWYHGGLTVLLFSCVCKARNRLIKTGTKFMF